MTDTREQDFTVSNFIEWLEKQPPDRRYDWTTASNCALGQWCKSMGMTPSAARAKSIALGRDEAFYDIALDYPYTFGAALERANALSLPSKERP